MYEFAVVIGRFQPFHNLHKAIVDRALSKAKQVIIVLGSCSDRRTARNPWLPAERRKMIKFCYPDTKLLFVNSPDFPDRDDYWAQNIFAQVNVYAQGAPTVLVGNCKPGEHYLQKNFPDWIPDLTEHHEEHISSTFIRDNFLGDYNMTIVRPIVPKNAATYLDWFFLSHAYDEAVHAYCMEHK